MISRGGIWQDSIMYVDGSEANRDAVRASAGQAEGDHARWRNEHLAWAGEVQVREQAIDAALVYVELALQGVGFTKGDPCSPLGELERMYAALTDFLVRSASTGIRFVSTRRL